MSDFIGQLTPKERAQVKRDLATVVRIMKKSRHVRCIVCALRGPDNMDYGPATILKMDTTARIRFAAGFNVGVDWGWDIQGGVLPNNQAGWDALKQRGGTPHFISHVQFAAGALRDIFGKDRI